MDTIRVPLASPIQLKVNRKDGSESVIIMTPPSTKLAQSTPLDQATINAQIPSRTTPREPSSRKDRLIDVGGGPFWSSTRYQPMTPLTPTLALPSELL